MALYQWLLFYSKLLSKFVHVGHRSQKGVLEEFHDKRRMSSILDYQSRPRLATPLKQNEVMSQDVRKPGSDFPTRSDTNTDQYRSRL